MKNCGNPFKALFPKKNNACMSPHLLSLLENFETRLMVSMAELITMDDENEFLTVSWMIQAMHSLCETHQGITTLVTDLDLHVSYMEESMYTDISAKLLQLCTAFSSEVTRLNHGNKLLKDAFSNPEEFSLSHLDRWRQHMASRNPRIENCGEVLSSLVVSMNHHHSLYKKVMKKQQVIIMQALYGVKAKTLYIFTVFAAAFSGYSKNILNVTIPKEMEEEIPWELLNIINEDIKNTLLSKRFTVIQDLEAVEFGVEKLYAAVQQGSVPNLLMVEPLKQSVMELSEKFDLLYGETGCLNETVISARDALLKKL